MFGVWNENFRRAVLKAYPDASRDSVHWAEPTREKSTDLLEMLQQANRKFGQSRCEWQKLSSVPSETAIEREQYGLVELGNCLQIERLGVGGAEVTSMVIRKGG